MRNIEKELSDMTALAKPEMERHNRQRILAMQSALTQVADSEVTFSMFFFFIVVVS